MKFSTRTCAGALTSLLLVACQTTKPTVAPAPEPRKVVVTDVAPSSAVVERSVARVEARVSETSAKVDAVGESVERAVEDAIRRNDQARVAELRTIEKQVAALRSALELAQDAAKTTAEEVEATRQLVAKMQAERDQARQDEAAAIAAHEAAQKAYAINLAAQQERTAFEKKQADKYKGRAWKLGGTLAALSLACLGYVAWRIFK